MKVAITGHTKGLGLACAKLFEKHGHTIVGLSRSNGFDLKNTEQIIATVSGCDVFINNAYHDDYQAALLNDLFHIWANTDKTIITIGSIITVYPRLEIERDREPWKYREHKQYLERVFRHLTRLPHTCHMQLISPGAIDTEMIAHLDCTKMPAETVAKIIYDTMSNRLIKELTIYE